MGGWPQRYVGGERGCYEVGGERGCYEVGVRGVL